MSADLLSELASLTRAAGSIALGHFRHPETLGIEAKAALDFVTRADRAVEANLREALATAFPADGIFGEEGSDLNPGAGRTFVIDPIDGTYNFMRGLEDWAISVGVFAGGRPVAGVIHAPARGLTLAGGPGLGATLNGDPLPPLGDFTGDRGLVALELSHATPLPQQQATLGALVEAGLPFRLAGATTMAFMMVARGQADACLGFDTASWDVMAGLAIIAGLGGENTLDWPDLGLRRRFRYACGKPAALQRLAPALAPPFRAAV